MAAVEETAGPSWLEFEPESHVYRVDGSDVPSVTRLLDAAGLTVDYSAVPRAVLAHARARGRHIDSCIDILDTTDDLDWETVHPSCVGYVDAWLKFRAEYGYEPVVAQPILYHPEHRYAGTADSVGRLNGHWVVVERKATAKMNDYSLQVAGYAQPGLWTAPPGGGRLTPVPWPAPARLGVHLRPDGYSVVPYEDDAVDLPTFLAVVRLHRWRQLRQRLG